MKGSASGGEALARGYAHDFLGLLGRRRTSFILEISFFLCCVEEKLADIILGEGGGGRGRRLLAFEEISAHH